MTLAACSAAFRGLLSHFESGVREENCLNSGSGLSAVVANDLLVLQCTLRLGSTGAVSCRWVS